MNTMKARRMLTCNNRNWRLFNYKENRSVGWTLQYCIGGDRINQHVPRPHTGPLWVVEHADSAYYISHV